MSSVADQRFTSNPPKPQLVTDDPVAKVMAAMRAHRRRLRPHGSAPNKWHGQCPCASSHRHGDRRDSLAITWDATTGRLLVKCHCGCPTASVVDALGLRLSDLFLSRQLRPNVGRRIVGEPVYYDYTEDESGAPIHVQKVRTDYSDGTKALHWRHECHGEWRPGLSGVRVGLFNIGAVHGAPMVFGCEGEGNAVAINHAGLPAVSVPHGASGWRDSYTASLVRAAIGLLAVIPDADRAGWRLAEQALHSCFGHVPVRLVRLPGVPRSGDVVDYFAAGHGADDLRRLVAAVPDWNPAQAEQARVQRRRQVDRDRQRRCRDRRRQAVAVAARCAG